MGSDVLPGVFRAFSNLHRKMSDCSICNIAGLIQTSENVCLPDKSTYPVLVLLCVTIIHLGHRNMS